MSNIVKLYNSLNSYVSRAVLVIPTAFTLFIRVKFSDWKAAGYQSIIGNGNAGAWDTMLYRIMGNDKLRAHVTTNPSGIMSFDSATGVIPNRWYHITMIWNRPNLNLYFDALMDTNAINRNEPIAGFNTAWYIGYDGRPAVYSPEMVISEAQLYNRALSQNEIRYNYEHTNNPIKNGLMFNYTQDSIYGATWVDLVAGANGTYVNGAVPVVANRLAGR